MSDAQIILNVVGERIALGPVLREHIPLLNRWFNDFGTKRSSGIPPLPQTLEQTEAWYEQQIVGSPDRMWFMVYEREPLRPIGYTGLRDIDHMHGTAEFAVTIGEPVERGKGFGTEAARLTLDYAFSALGLKNVLLDVFEFNLAGIRAYEKAGFREIGRWRKAEMMGGKLWDAVFMEARAEGFESPVLGRVFVPDEPRGA